MEKLDLNQVVDTVSGWLHTNSQLLSWVVAGAVALLLLAGFLCLVRFVFKMFGGQFLGPNLAYILLTGGSTALGAGCAAYNGVQAWVGALIGFGIGAIVSGVCCTIGIIARYAEQ